MADNMKAISMNYDPFAPDNGPEMIETIYERGVREIDLALKDIESQKFPEPETSEVDIPEPIRNLGKEAWEVNRNKTIIALERTKSIFTYMTSAKFTNLDYDQIYFISKIIPLALQGKPIIPILGTEEEWEKIDTESMKNTNLEVTVDADIMTVEAIGYRYTFEIMSIEKNKRCPFLIRFNKDNNLVLATYFIQFTSRTNPRFVTARSHRWFPLPWIYNEPIMLNVTYTEDGNYKDTIKALNDYVDSISESLPGLPLPGFIMRAIAENNPHTIVKGLTKIGRNPIENVDFENTKFDLNIDMGE